MTWDAGMTERLLSMRESGKTSRAIGAALGVSRVAVGAKIKRLGLPNLDTKRGAKPTEPIPDLRVRAREDRLWSAEEDQVIERFPDASCAWLANILVDRNANQIHKRRVRLRDGIATRQRARRPVRTPEPSPVQVPTRGQCQWLDGQRSPFRQCDQPAVLQRPDGSTCPEGAVWCATHRPRVYERRQPQFGGFRFG